MVVESGFVSSKALKFLIIQELDGPNDSGQLNSAGDRKMASKYFSDSGARSFITSFPAYILHLNPLIQSYVHLLKDPQRLTLRPRQLRIYDRA